MVLAVTQEGMAKRGVGDQVGRQLGKRSREGQGGMGRGGGGEGEGTRIVRAVEGSKGVGGGGGIG